MVYITKKFQVPNKLGTNNKAFKSFVIKDFLLFLPVVSTNLLQQQDRKCMYNVTLRPVIATIVAVEKL